MKQFLSVYILISLTFLGMSCKQETLDSKLFSKAESLSIRYPELAITVLDSIEFPELMSEINYQKYLIRMTQTRYLLNHNVSKDSLMLNAVDQFKQKKDWKYAALTEFNCGCILSDRKQTNLACDHLLEAEKLAIKANGPALKGMISFYLGDFRMNTSQLYDAIDHFRDAMRHYKKAGMYYPESAQACSRLATAFSRLERRDSALHYGYENFRLAKMNRDSVGVALAMQGVGDVEWQTGNEVEAEKAYLNALSMSDAAENQVRSHLNLAVIYYEQKKAGLVVDRVRKMEAELGSVQNPLLLASAYQFLKEWYQETGNKQMSNDADVRFNKILSDIVSEKRATMDWNESGKVFKLRHSFMESQSDGALRIWALVVTCLFLLLIVLLILLQNRRHRAALMEAKSNISTLQTMALEFQNKEDSLRQLALKHFNVLKRVALLDGMMKDLKSGQEQKLYSLFNQAVYENKLGFDWETFFQSINQLKNGLPDKVRLNYPQLSETEHKILILSFTGLSNKETSIILNLSTNTINSLRTSIRRKLKVPEYGDLEAFVTNQL